MDTLTNLYRKDAFEQFLEKELELFKRTHILFSVIYIDIDDFKEINDTFGHWSGDKVLEKIGEKINQNIRASDIGFRIGGDEFSIILKGSNQEQTLKICEAIKSEVAQFEFVYDENQSFFTDTSIGFITCDNIAEVPTAQEIIKRVDQELYNAKKRGKGNISFS
jgi:diguanylate cyclase (GGDEF)-like protein